MLKVQTLLDRANTKVSTLENKYKADEEKRGSLLDQGIYARIRHPRYVEILFITFGYAAVANFAGPWVLAFLSLPLIHAVVLLEERELEDRFGDAYRDYAARVPRYFPREWRQTRPHHTPSS